MPTTTLDVRRTGSGPAILLLHGAGEDVSLLSAQAHALADRGFTAITYDRRGTGSSTRDDWPSGGVPRHVADAADLLRVERCSRVLGFSSGAVLAMAVACAHPDLVTDVVAWEPAAVSVLADGDELHAMMMAPARAHLEAHPEDWEGAYDLMLLAISNGEADLGDPTVAAMRRNAEAAVRDDAEIITRHRFVAEDLARAPFTVAVRATSTDLHALIAARLAGLSGRPPWPVPGTDDHEVYLHRPEVLAEALWTRSSTTSSDAAPVR
jgi:pimeloyl-ACP methyl ester carboxylesterase